MVTNSKPKTFPVQEFSMGDPLLRWLGKYSLPPILWAATYAVLFQSLRGFVTWLAGHLRTVGVTTGYLDTPATYTNLLFGTVVTTYYLWMPQGIYSLFKGLYENGVVGEPRPNKKGKVEYSHKTFAKALDKSFSKWQWFVPPLVVTLAATLVLILPQYLESPELVADRADPVSFVLTVLWVFLGLYFVLLDLVLCTLTIYWLVQMFKHFHIEIRPLNPDRAGGLSPLGNFTLSLSYIIAFVGVILVVTPVTRNLAVAGTWQFRWTTELLVGLGVYAGLAPVVFFAPLWVARRSMKESKDQLLKEISLHFDEQYSRVRAGLKGDLATLEDSTKILKELQELHDTVSKFPVWPFNAANLTRFGTSYVTPVLLAVAVDLLTRLF